jgi:hypothetical protein
LCNEELSTTDLMDFFRECFSYRFVDKPKYSKLRAILNSLIELEVFSDTNESEDLVADLEGNYQNTLRFNN